MRAVKGVDVAVAVVDAAPTGGLNGSGGDQGEFVVFELTVIFGSGSAFKDQPPHVAEGADVIEPVVVDAKMGDVRVHVAASAVAADRQKRLVVGGVEGEQRGAELKAAGPFGPALRFVTAGAGDDRRLTADGELLGEALDLRRGELPEAIARG